MTATVTDPDRVISTLHLYLDDTFRGYMILENGVYKYTIRADAPIGPGRPSAGTHTLYARAFHNAYPAYTDSETLLLQVTEPPSTPPAPTVTLLPLGNGGVWGTSESFEVKASASAPDGPIARVEFYMDDVKRATAYVGNGVYSALVTRPPGGTHTLYARAYDYYGIQGTSEPLTLEVPEGQLVDVSLGAAGFTNDVTATSAMLSGTINSHTTYLFEQYFEVGLTTSYGLRESFPQSRPDRTYGDQGVSGYFYGLQRNTTYHYRLVARNYAGTAYSPDATFTTPENLNPIVEDSNWALSDLNPIEISVYFQDPDGDPTSITAISTPSHGTAVLTDSNHLVYTPNATFDGLDQFFVTVSDDHGGSSTGTIRVGNVRQKGAGTYVTTVRAGTEDDPNGLAVGEATIKVTSTGRFTGSFKIYGKKYVLSGQISVDGRADFEIDRKGHPPITGYLALWVGPNGVQLDGHIVVDGKHYWFERDEALTFPKSAPEAGSYTIALPASDSDVPEGNGYVTGHVMKRGQVVFAGKIGDGQSFSFGTQLHSGGGAQFFVSAGSAPKDKLFGNLQFPGQDSNECTGTVVWTKAARSTGYFQSGFTTTLEVHGSRFETPALDETLLQYSGELATLGISFTDPTDDSSFEGLLVGSTERSLQLQENTSVQSLARSVVKAPKSPLSFSFNRKKGTYSGKIALPSDPKHPRSFSGVLLPHQNGGAGLVKFPGRTGSVTLIPQ